METSQANLKHHQLMQPIVAASNNEMGSFELQLLKQDSNSGNQTDYLQLDLKSDTKKMNYASQSNELGSGIFDVDSSISTIMNLPDDELLELASDENGYYVEVRDPHTNVSNKGIPELPAELANFAISSSNVPPVTLSSYGVQATDTDILSTSHEPSKYVDPDILKQMDLFDGIFNNIVMEQEGLSNPSQKATNDVPVSVNI